MSNTSELRQCFSLAEDFFCDGPSYVITSSSLGGGGLTPQELANTLRQGNQPDIEELLKRKACLPLFFPGDCAFDQAIVILGNLTEQENNEWIGRIAWQLNIPCGKLMILCGGGDVDGIENAIAGDGYDGYTEYFKLIDVPAGEYLVEIYAYVSSMTVDFYFEEDEPLEDWFKRTRPNIKLPKWLQYFKEQGMIGELSDELVSYILRLSPLKSEPPLPKLDEVGWCSEFEFRRPELCPLGITRSSILN